MLRHQINRIYTDNKEMDAIIAAVQPELDRLSTEIQNHFNDTLPVVATLDGVLRWEIILGIVADPSSEPLEFRQGRIINRLSSNTPFTERVLQEIMDNIMGVNGWSYDLDYRNYQLDITSLIPGRNWLNEMSVTLEKIIPANLLWYLHMYFNTHARLTDFTHSHLSQLTHAQLMEDDIGA